MPHLLAPDPTMVEIDERLSSAEKWIAAHEARCTIQWEQQHKWNSKQEGEHKELRAVIESKFDAVFKRLGMIDKRLAWFTGLAAAAGSTVGAFIS